MRLSPTWAQVAVLSAMRHTVMVVRGRRSGVSAAPSITTASWASAMLSRMKSPESRIEPRCRLKQRTRASMAASAATSPPMCPPMPSATVSRMRVSVTTMDARSWLSLRLPWRLTWAVSTFKLFPPLRAAPRGCALGIGGFSLPFRTRPHPRPTGTSMARSMTGFARREARGDFGVLVWEARSVNHRYLDMSLRLPEELRALESECRERIAAEVKRGKLDAQLRFEPAAGAHAVIQVDEARARAVSQALTRVAGIVGAAAPLDPMDVLRWPGVVVEPPLDVAAVGKAAVKLLGETLTDLLAARGREGERTAAALRERAQKIAAIVMELRKHQSGITATLRDKLRARVEELKVQLDPARLEQEVVMLAQRLDVAE